MKAVLVVSHGSRSSKTKEEILVLVDELRRRMPGTIFAYSFLEIETPSIPEGIDYCVSKGADTVTLALNFLNSGKHVNHDIPSIVEVARRKHPKTKIVLTKPIGQHPQIPDLFIDLIRDSS